VTKGAKKSSVVSPYTSFFLSLSERETNDMWTLRCLATNTYLVVLLCQLILCCHHGTARHQLRSTEELDSDKLNRPLLTVENVLEEPSPLAPPAQMVNTTEIRPKRQLGKRPGEHSQYICGGRLHVVIKTICEGLLYSGQANPGEPMREPSILTRKCLERYNFHIPFISYSYFCIC